MEPNPYEPSSEIVRAELVPEKRGSVARIIQGVMLWMVGISAVVAVGWITSGDWFDRGWPIEAIIVCLAVIAVLIAAIYRIIGLYR